MEALTILISYKKLLENNSCDNVDEAISELEAMLKEYRDMEHYTHYTNGLLVTDNPSLIAEKINDKAFTDKYFWKQSYFKKNEN